MTGGSLIQEAGILMKRKAEVNAQACLPLRQQPEAPSPPVSLFSFMSKAPSPLYHFYHKETINPLRKQHSFRYNPWKKADCHKWSTDKQLQKKERKDKRKGTDISVEGRKTCINLYINTQSLLHTTTGS